MKSVMIVVLWYGEAAYSFCTSKMRCLSSSSSLEIVAWKNSSAASSNFKKDGSRGARAYLAQVLSPTDIAIIELLQEVRIGGLRMSQKVQGVSLLYANRTPSSVRYRIRIDGSHI